MEKSTTIDPRYSKELWEELFTRYFQDDIYKLAKSFPVNRYLFIPYTFIEDRWSDGAVKFFITRPEIALKDANDTLHAYTLPMKFSDEMKERWCSDSGIKISGYPVIPIETLGARHFNTFVSVTGTILERSNIIYILLVAAFQCLRCDHVTQVCESGMFFVEPLECENDMCGRKGPFKFVKEECVWADARKIKILGKFPLGTDTGDYKVDAILIGDVDCPPLGSTVTVSGILKEIQNVNKKVKTVEFSKLLEINIIERQLDGDIHKHGDGLEQYKIKKS